MGRRYDCIVLDPPAFYHVRSTEFLAESCANPGQRPKSPIHFVIADGIMAMEGNAPLNGTPRPLKKIVLADDPVAADATCARLMGFEPGRIVHIREGARFLGNAASEHIDQVGETVRVPATPFRQVQEFMNLYAF